MKIALFTLRFEQDHSYISKVLDFLKEKNIEIYIYFPMVEGLKSQINWNEYIFKTFDKKEELQSVSKLFTFGGDGTILKAVAIIQDLQIPIFGINTGRLGFLANFKKSEFILNFKEIICEDFKTSDRSLIEVNSDLGINSPIALNDVAITRKETTSMITIDAKINGIYLNTFWGDGLIISTPTGSTGYSLSCGGPILTPTNSDFIITPIAPHNLNVRPLTISDNSVVELSVKSRFPEYLISLDSRIKALKLDQKITVKKASFKAKLGIPKSYSYYDTLRKKLYWGVDSRN